MRRGLPWSLAAAAVLVGVCPAGDTPESAFNRNPWPAEDGPIEVFILAGQSNMQGQASLRTLEYLVYSQETAPRYQQWKDRDGRWTRRNDVWVWTTDGTRWGALTPGFGAGEWKFGPELGFGWTVGKKLDKQVLLIKTCWGGRSVRRNFLPPSAERPSEEELNKELEKARKRKPETTLADVKARYGHEYRLMVRHVTDVLGRLDELFPKHDKRQGYRLAGLVWFQGWNDMVDGEQRAVKYADYTRRLALMIKDLRKDLSAPGLPVVIGELGAGGDKGNAEFRAAQRAVAELPELKGSVTFVETHQFWRPEVEKMVDEGVWKGPEWPSFYNVGSDRGYHYLGSGEIYYRIGTALGEAMLERLAKP